MPTRSELRRLIPFTLLLFCLCIAYNMLRAIKDVITLTTYNCGAEVIPFLKVWGALPGSVILAATFAWLSQRLRRQTIFYLFLGGFLTYYLSFAYFFYPNMELLRASKIAVVLHHHLPAGCCGLVHMVENWPATLFYVVCELWPTALIAVLFWGFANQSFSTEEASRNYGLMKVGATASALCAGTLASLLTVKTSVQGCWEATFFRQIHAVTILGLMAIAIFAYMQRHVIPAPETPTPIETRKQRGLIHSIRIVMGDRRLICLAVLVLGYNMVYNCIDVLWKAQIREAYPNPNDLMRFISSLTAAVGTFALLAALSSSWIVRRLGWTALAVVTPAVMLILSTSFFSVLFFGEGKTIAWGATAGPIGLLVMIGAAQNALTKACKYSVFDISKEIAFTSLDRETQWSGKTAIDGVGNDLGKTGASLTQQAFLLGFGNLSVAAPWLAAIVFVVLFAWLYAVKELGKQHKLESSES